MPRHTVSRPSARLPRWIWIACAFLALSWLSWTYVVVGLAGWPLSNLAAAGQFGDAMAFFGSIATAVALFVSAYSVHLQREDINAQLAELTKTATAQDRLASAQEADTTARRIDAVLRFAREVRDGMRQTLETAQRYCTENQAVMDEEARHSRANGGRWSDAKVQVDRWSKVFDKLHEAREQMREELDQLELALFRGLAGSAGPITLPDLVEQISKTRSAWYAHCDEVSAPETPRTA